MKIQINKNKSHKNKIMDLNVLNKSMDMFEIQNPRPLVQKIQFAHIDFCAFFKNWSTLAMHISLNFNPMRVLLDFLDSLGCTLNNNFGFISIGSSMLM